MSTTPSAPRSSSKRTREQPSGAGCLSVLPQAAPLVNPDDLGGAYSRVESPRRCCSRPTLHRGRSRRSPGGRVPDTGQRPPQVLAEALVPCRVAGERVAHLAHAALQGGQPGGARQQQACVVITPASECGVSLQCSWSISRNERNGLRIQWIQLNAAECASSQSACWRTGICPPQQHASRGAVVLDPSGEGPPRAERRRHKLGAEQRDAAGAKRVVDAL